MSRPVRNKSVFWSDEHAKLLWHLAKQVQEILPWAELDDLASIGWYKQARYYENLHGRSKDIKREMFHGSGKICPIWYEIQKLHYKGI